MLITNQLEGFRRKSVWQQTFFSLLLIGVPALCCYLAQEWIPYRVVAFILLLILSFVAAVFGRIPTFIATIFSALTWDFFFIPPRFTFNISSKEDFFLLLMYFIIAFFNILITRRIKEIDKAKVAQIGQEHTIELYNTLLQSLSHELRTPIASIIGAIDTLNEHEGELSNQHELELKQAIQISAIRLNDQVEKLLCMSRMEANSLPLQKDWTDLNELIYTSVSNHTLLYPSRIFEIKMEEHLPYYFIDSSLIEVVVFNLIQNAHHYSPENKSIEINVNDTPSGFNVSVRDYGNGIPVEMHKTIFEKFVRLPNTKTGGTGLGLSIVKGFVTAHEGEVSIQIPENGGTAFHIQIPAEKTDIQSIQLTTSHE